MLQQRLKILHAVTKTWHSQINKLKKKRIVALRVVLRNLGKNADFRRVVCIGDWNGDAKMTFRKKWSDVACCNLEGSVSYILILVVPWVHYAI